MRLRGLSGLVYPDFPECVSDSYPAVAAAQGSPTWFGGIDWGFNNPFCALWGFRTRDDVLWIVKERYKRQTALHEHVGALKAERPLGSPEGSAILWHADPAGPTGIQECRSAGLRVRRGSNDIQLGIMAITARLRTGRLKVYRAGCPNLIKEAQLYRYPDQSERAAGYDAEKPLDRDNHALGALRYLVSRIDERSSANSAAWNTGSLSRASQDRRKSSSYPNRSGPRKNKRSGGAGTTRPSGEARSDEPSEHARVRVSELLGPQPATDGAQAMRSG